MTVSGVSGGGALQPQLTPLEEKSNEIKTKIESIKETLNLEKGRGSDGEQKLAEISEKTISLLSEGSKEKLTEIKHSIKEFIGDFNAIAFGKKELSSVKHGYFIDRGAELKNLVSTWNSAANKVLDQEATKLREEQEQIQQQQRDKQEQIQQQKEKTNAARKKTGNRFIGTGVFAALGAFAIASVPLFGLASLGAYALYTLIGSGLLSPALIAAGMLIRRPPK